MPRTLTVEQFAIPTGDHSVPGIEILTIFGLQNRPYQIQVTDGGRLAIHQDGEEKISFLKGFWRETPAQ